MTRGLYEVIIYDYKKEEVLYRELVFSTSFDKACNEGADIVLRKDHSIKDLKMTTQEINTWEKEVE